MVIGGTPPYLYNWNNGSTSRDQTGLSAGFYQLTVTDAGLSTISMDFEITEPVPMSTVLRAREYEAGYNISEMGGSDGMIRSEISGGVLPYSYLWSNGSKEHEINGLRAGTYSLTTTSRNGCKDSASVTLTEPSALQIVSITSPSQHGYNISCFEKKDGTINLTVTGGAPPYEYKWIDGYSKEDRTELGPGTYIVAVTDFQQTKAIAQIVLTEPPLLEVQSSPYVYPNGRNVSCYGCSNGMITSTATGGVTPYTYLWQGGVATANRSNIGTGNYNLVTTDANGCTVETAVQLEGPERDDWTMSGNVGTNPPMQFIGTLDNKDVVFKTNNAERIRIKANGILEAMSGIKLTGLAVDSFSSVYVDQDGVLRIGEPGTITNPAQCKAPVNTWFRDVCAPLNSNSVYKYPLTGSVGIGTELPTAKLEVVGKGKFTSFTNSLNSIAISHNGNDGEIDLLGAGSLLINGQGSANINLCTGGGNVGIGTISPKERLQIGNRFTFHADDINNMIGSNSYFNGTINKRITAGNASRIKFTNDGEILIQTSISGALETDIAWIDGIRLKSDGKVGIGTFTTSTWDGTDYKLYVKGGIRTESIKVDLSSNGWADYVFADNYSLRSIKELRIFISENKHLPGIPTEAEVREKGVDLLEMQIRLLEKIEELSIYITQLEQRIELIEN